MLKVYLVQMGSLAGEKEKNFSKAREMVLEASPAPQSLVLLPEMFDTGYVPQLAKQLSQENARPDTPEFLQKLSDDTNCFVCGGGMRRQEAGVTNHVGIYAPGKTCETAGYDKNHLFFPELETFTAGREISLFKIRDFCVSTTICFDLRFPEQYRNATLQGAQLFTVHAAWPAKRKDHWEALLKARAIENQAYVAAVNCVSTDGLYTGDSRIIDPLGNVIVQADAGKEYVVSGEIDINSVNKCRSDFPLFRQ